MKRLLCCLFAAYAIPISTPGLAADWPIFRGPEQNGHAAATKLPLNWSDTQNVNWRTAVPGKGWSSPVIVANRVYLTSAVPADGANSKEFSLRAICLDAISGKILWNEEVFHQGATAPSIHSKNSHASPTPVVDGDRVFVHFGHNGTACLSTDGKFLWKNDKLKYPPVHGNGGTPVLVNNVLIFSCDGGADPFIVGLDGQTGETVWKTPRQTDAKKKFSFSTPTAITVNGELQVVSPGSGAVFAYDPSDGREIWRVRYDGYSVIPKPVFANQLLYVCTGYDSPSLMAIRADGQGDVTDSHVVWTHSKAVPHAASPVIVENELFMVSDNGIASCLDASTGKPHWQQRLGGNYSASPIYAAGRVLFLSEEGDAHVIEPADKYRQLAKNSIGERTLASYAVVDHALFIRSENHLYRIENSSDN